MTFALVLVACLNLGCSQGSRSEPLGFFLVTKLTAYGANLPPTENVPELRGRWKFQEDSNGFKITVIGGHFEQLDKFLTSHLGEPYISTDRNLAGFRQRVYKLGAAGPVLQYQETASGADIICVKNSSQWKP